MDRLECGQIRICQAAQWLLRAENSLQARELESTGVLEQEKANMVKLSSFDIFVSFYFHLSLATTSPRLASDYVVND